MGRPAAGPTDGSTTPSPSQWWKKVLDGGIRGKWREEIAQQIALRYKFKEDAGAIAEVSRKPFSNKPATRLKVSSGNLDRALETHQSKCPTAQSIKDSVEFGWTTDIT